MPHFDEHDQPEKKAPETPEEKLIKAEKRERILAALWQLPPHHRIAIELRHFQDLSYREMADELDLPINTVRSHLYRARNKLAELLTAYEP
jgi:RNA polymerase sigma-70 factor (ECF subfamily)